MLLERLRRAFPPNRIAALGGFVTGLALQITTLANTFPTTSGVAKAAGVIVGGLTSVGSLLAWFVGQHKWEASPAGQAHSLAQLPTHGDFPVGQPPFEGPGADELMGADDAPPEPPAPRRRRHS